MRRASWIWLMILSVFLLSACSEHDARKPVAEVVFLDVGQGAAALLRTSDGDLLVDAGSETSQQSLCHRLRELGVKSLRLLVFTHSDEDHTGGGDGVLSAFSVEEIWVNGASSENESTSRWREVANEKSVPVRAVSEGHQLLIGGFAVTVLYPNEHSEAEGNEGSLVLTVRHSAFSLLMMGDAGERAEAELLSRYGEAQIKTDLLHVGHHGANSSSSEAFLSVAKPTLAIISCGAENLYGHPDGRTLERLARVGAEICRTDLLGEITVGIDGDGYWLTDRP